MDCEIRIRVKIVSFIQLGHHLGNGRIHNDVKKQG